MAKGTMTDSTTQQRIFVDMVLGILIYSVVLGFFDDYTDLLETTSYSVTFALAFLLQLLTYATLRLKKYVVTWFRGREGTRYKVGMAVGVWLIMFLSKFVFLAAIDRVLGHSVDINGFVGIMVVVAVMVVAQRVIEAVYHRLGV